MFSRPKPLSEEHLRSMVYQIRYLTEQRKVPDKMLVYHLSKMLRMYGVRTDDVSMPRPKEKR